MILDPIYWKAENRLKREGCAKDKWGRSVIKSISWRALGTLDTIVLSYFISGDFRIAFSIGSFELLTKTVLYFFHERLWERIKWGKKS